MSLPTAECYGTSHAGPVPAVSGAGPARWCSQRSTTHTCCMYVECILTRHVHVRPTCVDLSRDSSLHGHATIYKIRRDTNAQVRNCSWISALFDKYQVT